VDTTTTARSDLTSSTKPVGGDTTTGKPVDGTTTTARGDVTTRTSGNGDTTHAGTVTGSPIVSACTAASGFCALPATAGSSVGKGVCVSASPNTLNGAAFACVACNGQACTTDGGHTGKLTDGCACTLPTTATVSASDSTTAAVTTTNGRVSPACATASGEAVADGTGCIDGNNQGHCTGGKCVTGGVAVTPSPTTTSSKMPACNNDVCRAQSSAATSTMHTTAALCASPLIFKAVDDCCGVCATAPTRACTGDMVSTNKCSTCKCDGGVVGACSVDPTCMRTTTGVDVTVTVKPNTDATAATTSLFNDVVSKCLSAGTTCSVTVMPVAGQPGTYSVHADVTQTMQGGEMSTTSNQDILITVSSNPLVQNAQLGAPTGIVGIAAAAAPLVGSTLVALLAFVLAF